MTTKHQQTGSYRHRLSVWAKQDGDWTKVSNSIPFSIEALSGRDLEYARAQWNTATHQLKMHWHPKIKTSRQLRWDVRGVKFGIRHVDDLGGPGTEMTVIVEEIR